MPVIISPFDDDEFKTTDFIKFEGECNDIDLDIAGSSEELEISWWSDISGKIDNGPLLENIFLSEGKHIITLKVVDKEGMSNSAMISIKILKDTS